MVRLFDATMRPRIRPADEVRDRRFRSSNLCRAHSSAKAERVSRSGPVGEMTSNSFGRQMFAEPAGAHLLGFVLRTQNVRAGAMFAAKSSSPKRKAHRLPSDGGGRPRSR